VIIGARTQQQLGDNLAATSLEIPAAVLARLEDATQISPEYPNAFIDVIQGWLGNR